MKPYTLQNIGSVNLTFSGKDKNVRPYIRGLIMRLITIFVSVVTLSILMFVLIQQANSKKEIYSKLIDVAGSQRYRSMQIRLAMAEKLRRIPPILIQELTQTHEALKSGYIEGKKFTPSDEIRRLLDACDSLLAALTNANAAMPDAHQFENYLKTMNQVVILFSQEITEHLKVINWLTILNIFLLAAALLTGLTLVIIPVIKNITKLFAELKIARDDYATAHQNQSRFLATLAHEIKTPLTAIIGLSELITSRNCSNVTCMGEVSVIKRMGEQTNALISEILLYEKLIHQKQKNGGKDLSPPDLAANPQMASLWLPDLCQYFTIIAESLLRKSEKPLSLETDFKNTVYHVCIDKETVFQILMNFLQNAIRYSQRGIITIGAEIHDSEIIFSVKDQGVGIKEEDQERIFNPFEKANENTSPGLGLGLALCRQLAESMQGRIWLTSEMGRGSVFYFALPFSQCTEKPATKMPAASATELPPTHKLRKSLTILVIDDNELNLMILCRMVEKLGHTAIGAASGKDGLTKIGLADMVFLDYNMPDMNGVQCLNYIRTVSQIPVLACTAADTADSENFFREAGFSGFIAKPVNLQTLGQAIEQAKQDSGMTTGYTGL